MKFPRVVLMFAFLCGLMCVSSSFAQKSSDAIHEIDVRLKARTQPVGGVRVRLVNESRMLPVAETISSQDGQIRFTRLLPGKYIVETGESEAFEATATRVSILALELKEPQPTRVMVTIDLPACKRPDTTSPGVVTADVDVGVPEAALRHYEKGSEALRSENTAEAVKEFQTAVEVYPKYYAARLELGRGLRAQKRFQEAEETLRPLGVIAPQRPEARVELAIVLLALKRPKEAAGELRKALEMDEANWATHLYLGWALLGDEPQEAERHFTRALELNEQKAAQAHLSLARLANARGMRQDAIRHLEAYLALAPNAPDANAVRNLLGQLRK